MRLLCTLVRAATKPSKDVVAAQARQEDEACGRCREEHDGDDEDESRASVDKGEGCST